MIPANFVKVMPERTLLPVVAIALADRSLFVPTEVVYALTMCETNSTPMPTAFVKRGRVIPVELLVRLFMFSIKLNGENLNGTHHHQIDQGHRIQGDIPQPHYSRHINNHEQDHKGHHESENQIKS